MASRSRTRRSTPSSFFKGGRPSSTAGHVRIIGGRWRGRKLDVPSVEGLRPTGDRVRETLFNWLQSDIAGAQCLDLFAGTGALGFESLSRYARHVAFVEPNRSAVRCLRKSCDMLDINVDTGQTIGQTNEPATEQSSDEKQAGATDTPTAQLVESTARDALEYWQARSDCPKFDLVFIDPPFEQGCQWETLALLAPHNLSKGALVYIEAPTRQSPSTSLPQECVMVREKKFGDVMTHLVRYQ